MLSDPRMVQLDAAGSVPAVVVMLVQVNAVTLAERSNP